MFGHAHELVAEFDELTRQLADPATHADTALSRRVGRRYAELTPIIKGLAEHEALVADLGLALAYTVYAYVFNWCYDRLFPIGPDQGE